MNFKSIFFTAILLLFGAQIGFSQAVVKNTSAIEPLGYLKSSPAFAEIILRKTELLAEVESLLVTYTEEFPRVKSVRYELDLLNTELNRLLRVNLEQKEKLSFALGKLIVRKAELESDHQTLKLKYGDEHPDVKRAKRKVDIYEKGIKDILG